MAGSLSFPQVHADEPFTMEVGGEHYTVGYVPGESNTYVFGGNSNWRGPIWLCGKSISSLQSSSVDYGSLLPHVGEEPCVGVRVCGCEAKTVRGDTVTSGGSVYLSWPFFGCSSIPAEFSG